MTAAGVDGPVLIVNADDLGRTVGINDGIFAAHRAGLVTSATLMVGFAAAVDAARRLLDHPALGVGLHVTLTGGTPPTLPAARLPSLVDGAGRLPRRPDGLGGALYDEVLAEVRHQLELFRQLTGSLPTHLDSHHHSHRVPVVLDAVATVSREHHLPVRRSSEHIASRLATDQIATTAVFVEDFFDHQATLPVLLEIIAAAGRTDGITEVMCHPGNSDPDLSRDSTYAAQREGEIVVLTDPAARAAVVEHGLRLGTFAELAAESFR